jgi:hypothetical protein
MNLRKYLSSMREYEPEDVLRALGLQRRTTGDWIFPMLAGLGAGVAIGAGIAVFLTPYKGEEARERFRKSASDAQRLLGERVQMLSDKVQALGAGEGTTRTATAAPTAGIPNGSVGTGNRTY